MWKIIPTGCGVFVKLLVFIRTRSVSHHFDFGILQEEIVDETDEYVDVHKRYVSSLQEVHAPGILPSILYAT